MTYFLKKHREGQNSDGNPESKESDGLCTSLPLISKLVCSYYVCVVYACCILYIVHCLHRVQPLGYTYTLHAHISYILHINIIYTNTILLNVPLHHPPSLCRLCVLGVSDQKFTQLVTDCASILAANPIAMTHTLASAAILRALIYGGIEGLNEGSIIEAALSGSGGSDAELKAEIDKVSVCIASV